MKEFLNDNDFMLHTDTAQTLYHRYAQPQPIIDYHNHLSPALIAADHRFASITELWLKGDHYKWRAMRANGIRENDITGSAADQDKFRHWAATVPYTMRSPLYHWTHLELRRYFGIYQLLNEQNADELFEACNEMLRQPEFSARNLLRRMNVQVLCTTDDPCDALEHHARLRQEGFEIKVLPTFRPDAAIAVENPTQWNEWVNRLAHVTGTGTFDFSGFIQALRQRHDFFAEMGCRLSDHGMETMYAEAFDEADIETIYDGLRAGSYVSPVEIAQFKSAVLYHLALLDQEKGWAAQWHIGAIRNNNSRLSQSLGADAGADSIGDFAVARSMAAFFDRLNSAGRLGKHIIYNLNPAHNEVYATMIGNFQNALVPGQMQYGSAWWFLDQKDGMEKQLNALSNMGLLSRFVGMLTDSRSFLSFPRHEYFRRILCNLLGNDVEQGDLPASELPRIGRMVENICYYNAKNYFNF